MTGMAATRRGLLAGAAALAATPALAWADGDEGARLNALFEASFQRDLARSPTRQSRLALKTNQDRWDDISDAFRAQGAALAKADLAAVRRFDDGKLGVQDRLSRRMFEMAQEERLKGFEWRGDEYLLTQMGGWHRSVATTLLNSHPIATVADGEAYVARLHGVRPLFAQLLVELTRQEAAGVKPPRFVYDLLTDECANLVKGAPFAGAGDSPIWADLKAKLAKASFPQADKDRLAQAGEAAMTADFGPAYQGLIAHLDQAKATATTDDGVWKLPRGDAYYRYTLEQFTTLPLTAEHLHALGLSELAKIQDGMKAIMAQTGFEGSLQDFFAFVRKDPQFYYPDSAEGRAQFLDDAKARLAEVQAREGEFLGIKPKASVEVRPVEAWREKSAAKAFYSNASEDGTRPGIFYINLYDMGAAPKYQLPVELYHEAVPGHHIETMVAYELKGLPKFRKFASIAAFSEGWGLYSEQLAHELGLYKTPYDEFGRLTLQAMRACRLVVDTGIHAKRWTREQAIAFMDENMPASHYDNQREIERYIVYPGQACSYYVGMMKILELRAKAKAALGSRFDIRAFHDAVLGNGPVPLPILEETIGAWISAQGAGV
jgi:uncharacterized protein (DUF885 family)